MRKSFAAAAALSAMSLTGPLTGASPRPDIEGLRYEGIQVYPNFMPIIEEPNSAVFLRMDSMIALFRDKTGKAVHADCDEMTQNRALAVIHYNKTVIKDIDKGRYYLGCPELQKT